MRTAAMKVTNDITSNKTNENYCHRDFRWHNLEKQMRTLPWMQHMAKFQRRAKDETAQMEVYER
jgi:hypothetical protein